MKTAKQPSSSVAPSVNNTLINALLAAIGGGAAAAASMGAYWGILYLAQTVIFENKPSWGLLGFLWPAWGVALILAGLIPVIVLKKIYGKRMLPLIGLSYGLLIACYVALQSYSMQSSSSVMRDVVALAAINATYYLIAMLALANHSLKAQISVMILGLISLVIGSPLINALGTRLGHQAFQQQTEAGILKLPYTVYGPFAKFKLMGAKRTYEVNKPSRQVDLMYSDGSTSFTVQNLKTPTNYNPPTNCSTISGLVSNYENDETPLPCQQAFANPLLKDVYTLLRANPDYLYYIEKSETLLIIKSGAPISEANMITIQQSLREVTQDEMKKSPQGIQYGAGG